VLLQCCQTSRRHQPAKQLTRPSTRLDSCRIGLRVLYKRQGGEETHGSWQLLSQKLAKRRTKFRRTVYGAINFKRWLCESFDKDTLTTATLSQPAQVSDHSAPTDPELSCTLLLKLPNTVALLSLLPLVPSTHHSHHPPHPTLLVQA